MCYFACGLYCGYFTNYIFTVSKCIIYVATWLLCKGKILLLFFKNTKQAHRQTFKQAVSEGFVLIMATL